MSQRVPDVGDEISAYDELFADAFESPAEVRNWIEGDTADEHGDYPKEPHPDNPIQTTAQVEQPDDPVREQSAAGSEEAVDAEILLPDGVLITTGGETDANRNWLGWPSEITVRGRIYTVMNYHDEGNGRLMCLARHSGEVDD
jgi:hypothetical protein